MNNILIINVYDRYFVVTEKKRKKKIYRDALATGVCTGTVFDSIEKARAFARDVIAQGKHYGIIEVKFAKHVYDQTFNIWIVTHKNLLTKYSVYISTKSEDFSRSEVLEKSKFGRLFADYPSALEYATKALEQSALIFENDESSIVEKTIVEVDEETDITYDHYGEPVYLCNNPVWRKDEVQYQFIDIVNYRNELKQLSASDNQESSTATDLGTKVAYDFALFSGLPLLHSEIFRVEKFISLLKDDPESNEEEIEFYSSFIRTLTKCIGIQKQHRLPDDFRLTVLIYDETGIIKPATDACETIVSIGATLSNCTELDIHHDLVVYDNYDEFLDAVSTDPRQIVFVAYGNGSDSSTFAGIQTAVYEKTRQPVYICRDYKDIRKMLKHYVLFPLDYRSIVDNEWIYESSEEYNEYSDDYENNDFRF